MKKINKEEAEALVLDNILKKKGLSWSYSEATDKDLLSLKALEEVDEWDSASIFQKEISRISALIEAAYLSYSKNNKLASSASEINISDLPSDPSVDKRYYQNLQTQKLLSQLQKQKLKLSSGEEVSVIYNQFHTLTRRLSDSGKGYNILTISKDKRNVIPTNDVLLEIDFNAFEPRVALGLLGLPQPKGDFYSEIFSGLSREQAKKKMLVWLYGDMGKFETINGLEKSKLINSAYDGEKIKTPFGRQIPCIEQNAISYLVQSTASDLMLDKAYKIHKFIYDNKLKSKISYLVHDSIVFDIDKTEKELINGLISFFSDTIYGKMKLNVSLGKNSNKFERVVQ